MTQFRFAQRPHIGEKLRVSFEFFPPRTDEMEARLWETVTRLQQAEARYDADLHAVASLEEALRLAREALRVSTLEWRDAREMAVLDALFENS